MIVIKGEVRPIKRITADCPQDGVHVTGKDGKIKGVRGIFVDSVFVPYGMTGFYWQLNEDKGVKVFYSFKHDTWVKPWRINLIRKKMKKLHKNNICPYPHRLQDVEINLYHKDKKIRKWGTGMVVDHIHYPVEAIKKYAEGYPYSWNCINEPNHTPEGYKAFIQIAKEHIGDMDIGGDMKLGDVIYCTKRKEWRLVDIG